MSQMRIGGLASGMDIDSIVEKLMQAERAPLDKLEQQKQTYEWTRDKYREVNTKLQTFDTYIADNLILKNFNTKTVTSSNSALVTAIASGNASGTLSIEGVTQLATAARGIGEKIQATGNTKLSALFAGEEVPSEIKLRSIDKNGSLSNYVTISINKNMTIDELISKINTSGAGVSAIFEDGRLSITANNTGKVANGESAIQADDKGNDLFAKLGLNQLVTKEGQNAIFQVNGIVTERTSNTFSLNGYVVTLHSTFNSENVNAEKYNVALKEYKTTHSDLYNNKMNNLSNEILEAETNYQTSLNNYNNLFTTLFGAVSSEEINVYNKANNHLSFPEDLTTIKTLVVDDFNSQEDFNDWLSSIDETQYPDLRQKLEDSNITYEEFNTLKNLEQDKIDTIKQKNAYDTLGVAFLGNFKGDSSLLTDVDSVDALNEKINDWLDESNSDQEKRDLAEKLKNLNDNQKEALVELNLSGNELSDFASLASEYLDYQAHLATKNLKQAEWNALNNRQIKAEQEFEDAYKMQYGVELSEDPNNLSEVTLPTSTPVTLSATTNVDEIVGKIKDFVNKYNELVKELNSLVKEQKYRDYLPLTKAQREEMEEKEIELWEEKAKSGLLRGDSIIQNGLSQMRALIYQSHPAVSDPTYNTLYNIGITTSRSYNEGGTLEIDEDKLRKALEENPDAVAALFTNPKGKKDDKIVQDGEVKTIDSRGFLQRLRDEMTSIKEKIERKAGRASMTDTQYTLGKTLRDIENRMKTWETKLVNIEERYWKQFTAMEQAINKANMQASLFMPQY